MATLFLSYRSSDTGRYVGRLAERLRSFQFESVFEDREAIPVGANYADEIRRALPACEAVLVLIGNDWIGTRPDGGRRLDDPADWVRREVSAAISLAKVVVPVFFDGASPPDVSLLGVDLAPLATAQGYDVNVKYFDRDVSHLASRVERTLLLQRRVPRDERAPNATALVHQLAFLSLLLFVVTVVFAVAPAYFEKCPKELWWFPGAMTFAVFFWWLYWLGESVRPARARTI